MKQIKKRGFTLVELVIVIAVIAVLAAVLIPTFVSVVENANLSNDIGIVQQANTLLTANEAIEGKNKTFSEARADLLENGLDIAKIKASANKHTLAWDCEADRLVLLNGENVVVSPDDYKKAKADSALFAVAKSEADIAEGVLNYYLSDDFVAEGPLEVSVGIDVGNHVNLDISYTGTEKETRMFNTNGGTLTINNLKADVNHYGSAKVVAIEAVAQSSYHCYAEVVGSINVAQGHVVVEAGAEVPLINVVAPESESASAGVKIEYQPAAKQDIPVIVASDVAKDTLAEGAIPTSAPTVDLSEKGNRLFYSSYTNDVTAANIGSSLSAHKDATDYVLTALKDISLGGKFQKIYGKNVEINLNGHVLEFNDSQYNYSDNSKKYGQGHDTEKAITIENGLNLRITNGKIVCKNFPYGNLFFVAENSGLTLEDVEVETIWTEELRGKLKEAAGDGDWSGKLIAITMINVQGNIASVTMVNSSISSEFTYGIGTNANSAENYNVQIEVRNSEILGNCGILCNIPSTLKIEGSKITGRMQGIVLKGGMAEITNSEIAFDSQDTAENLQVNLHYFDEIEWKQGNYCNLAALTIGTKSEGYKYPVDVILSNCKLTSHAKNGNETAPVIYAWSANDSKCSVTIQYSGCTFEGAKIVLGGTPVSSLGDNNYGLNYLTVNGTSYADRTGKVELAG